MSKIDYGRAAKYFLLLDFLKGFKLGFKYFFAPKSTLNYPHEKGYLSSRFRGEHALRSVQTNNILEGLLRALDALAIGARGFGHLLVEPEPAHDLA